MGLSASFQSGRYSGTWNSSSLGVISDAFRIRQTMEAQQVRADFWGDSVIDLVYRGGNAFCVFEGLSWTSVAAVVGGATSIGTMGIANVGCLFGNAGLSKALVLTAVGSGGCAPAPTSITAAAANLAEGFDVEFALANQLRTLPIMMRLLPTLISSEVYWYVMA